MKRFLVLLAIAVLLLGCTQPIAPGGGNQSGGHVTPSNTTPGGSTPNSSGSGTQTGNGTQTNQPPASQFANYDLSIAQITLNTTQPTVSFFSGLNVEVKYDGMQKPSRYKVTYYDNGNLVETKTVASPSADEKVSFVWLPTTDGAHTINATVETYEEEKLKEDGPASNNGLSADFTVPPIMTVEGSDSLQFNSRFYRAQQFIVQNKIGIGTIAVDLKADQPIGDVPLIIELREDSGDKPATLLRTTTLSAKYLGSPQWYTISYGTNGVYLTKSKYWIVVYLGGDSENSPAWVTASGQYDGKSSVLDKSSGYGNVWSQQQGAFAFKVSTTPQ
ncbi:Uncharacterised protein [uncultured archaeon]|nr:Uncharacterised protein [uncultured archaeon]